MITGIEAKEQNGKVMHIINSARAESRPEVLASIGLTSHDLNSAQNCLFMLAPLEQAYDSCVIYNPLLVSNLIYLFYHLGLSLTNIQQKLCVKILNPSLTGEITGRISQQDIKYGIHYKDINLKPLVNQGN